MTRMVVTSPEYVKSKYNLKELKTLGTLVADAVQIDSVPLHTRPVGIRVKSILNNPSTYDIIDPALFSLSRSAAQRKGVDDA
ncbi:hypothetical protein G7Z17_g10128 [Cylindrodendrum hubeiense]|uniref:Uncharacterized protein n=1 Tax=Cylindrodendrum hubeiense TaxID=595255 RepID=A0A9P5H2P1_9HYPO|nr:hypothetical protein G7Z17_g10128 [Cylindrodendrum hubeiense]